MNPCNGTCRDGVPVTVYYMTTTEDIEAVEASGGDFGVIPWCDRVDRIEIDDCACDRMDIADELIAALVARLG